MADPIADDFAAIARRAREIAGQPAEPDFEGDRDGDVCGRNGCRGIISYGIVGCHGATGHHHEVMGVYCPECEWSEADYDYG